MKEKVYFKWIYELPPVDWWTGFLTLGEYLDALGKEMKELGEESFYSREIFLDKLVEGAKALGQAGYSDLGEMSSKYVIELPNPIPGNSNYLLLFFKFYDNGTTYVISPIELSYLEEEEKKAGETGLRTFHLKNCEWKEQKGAK